MSSIEGSHVAYRENCNFWIGGKEMDITEDECLICQKDPLMSALQPAYQLSPQLLQWVPPYRRPVPGGGHSHLYGKNKIQLVRSEGYQLLQCLHASPLEATSQNVMKSCHLRFFS